MENRIEHKGHTCRVEVSQVGDVFRVKAVPIMGDGHRKDVFGDFPLITVTRDEIAGRPLGTLDTLKGVGLAHAGRLVVLEALREAAGI
jgi:hypothetical protein